MILDRHVLYVKGNSSEELGNNIGGAKKDIIRKNKKRSACLRVQSNSFIKFSRGTEVTHSASWGIYYIEAVRGARDGRRSKVAGEEGLPGVEVSLWKSFSLRSVGSGGAFVS